MNAEVLSTMIGTPNKGGYISISFPYNTFRFRPFYISNADSYAPKGAFRVGIFDSITT